MATDAREIIAEALLAFVEGWSGEPDPEQGAAQAVHAALTEAGLLVEPGGETRTEWATLSPSTGALIVKWGSTDAARREAIEDAARFGSKVASRTIHTGPWRPASAILHTDAKEQT